MNRTSIPLFVIAGLDPAIQGGRARCVGLLDARIKSGHDKNLRNITLGRKHNG